MKNHSIKIRGARTHNLKDISLDIPRDKFIVITGPSGSGKSSLAFDTIYAEGQRRYVESLSSYARQFLGQVDRPDVEYIGGLSPAIAIKQRSSGGTPRSTVGTVTEIYDMLRILYARIGKPHCPLCGRALSSMTTQEIVDEIINMPEGTRIQILAPIESESKKSPEDLLRVLQKDGFTRVKINNHFILLDEAPSLPIRINKISVVVDRLIIKSDIKRRLTESVELALRKGKGKVIVDTDSKELTFSQIKECPNCGIKAPELTPQHFSFNNPAGACGRCKGLGVIRYFDPELMVIWPERTISEGAIPLLKEMGNGLYHRVIELMNHFQIDPYMPFYKLSKDSKDILFFGKKDPDKGIHFEGIIPLLENLYNGTKNPIKKRELERFIGTITCKECRGGRLNSISLSVRINDKSINDICSVPAQEALEFFKELKLTERESYIAGRLIKEITDRLGFLINVGVGYISLSRATSTLSGGEEQKIRLATQMGSSLSGVLYVLDEPTIGLHPKDTNLLINNIKYLKGMKNTVIVVEHDRDMILASDYVVDLGPGAGPDGGKIVFQGTPEELKWDKSSLTGRYLSRKLSIPRKKRELYFNHYITIEGASHHNLKDISLKIPLGTLTCITGVSGSGKSTLMYDIIYPELLKRVYGRSIKSGRVRVFKGAEYIDRVISIDQSPIGKSPRSNPATYTGIFSHIRELFSMLPDSRVRGYTASRFSFNVKGGRCEVCQGEGIRKVEMHFLPDVHITCDVCNGTRFNRDTLEIRYKGYNIAQILDMSVKEALPLFENIPGLREKLMTLMDVGLGYMKLGQPATTLSGGEAQRLKLSKELSKRQTGRTIYLMDEPTTGLHFEDIRRLLDVLLRLVELNNTVVVIEHHLDIIKNADFIIDLGPEGGDKGGYVVAMGPPEEIIRIKHSYTGKYLKDVLN